MVMGDERRRPSFDMYVRTIIYRRQEGLSSITTAATTTTTIITTITGLFTTQTHRERLALQLPASLARYSIRYCPFATGQLN